jgi:formylglycine-generating enzyme required for sulfatase activity
MMVVPAGDFTMGSNEYDSERPLRTVTIAKPFAVGKFEVTFDEWEACMASGGCLSNHRPSDAGWGRGRRPVIDVSWNDAQEYVTWLSRKTGKTYRLLTEAEWEYAARAGTTTKYPWGNDIGKGNANCNGCGSQWDNKHSAPVGSFEANAFGLHDMHGNVWEWVEDTQHANYKGAPTDGAAWIDAAFSQSSRILRGGSWDGNSTVVRSANRNTASPHLRSHSFGFRVATTISPSSR